MPVLRLVYLTPSPQGRGCKFKKEVAGFQYLDVMVSLCSVRQTTNTINELLVKSQSRRTTLQFAVCFPCKNEICGVCRSGRRRESYLISRSLGCSHRSQGFWPYESSMWPSLRFFFSAFCSLTKAFLCHRLNANL